MSSEPTLLVSRDPGLVEVITASAAARGSTVEVARELDALRRAWRSAPAVLIGADSAEFVSSLDLPVRGDVHLVGPEVTVLAAWSVPLHASVVPLPDATGVLARLLQPAALTASGGAAVWIVGAGGGLGCTTLALALAEARGDAAFVELDPLGGADLTCGAEGADGWRWPDLASASGQLDDLSGRVPRFGEVDLVAVGRSHHQPGDDAVRAVVQSLRRTHGFVVLDGGTRPRVEGVRTVLLVGADVRSVAAARALGARIDLAGADVVVRRGPGRSIRPELVADALGLPLIGVVPHDRRLPRLVEAGRTPASVRGPYRRAARAIAKALS